MKIKKLIPLNTAPVKRQNHASISYNDNGTAVTLPCQYGYGGKGKPFAGDDAE